jgi:hypothetical protein
MRKLHHFVIAAKQRLKLFFLVCNPSNFRIIYITERIKCLTLFLFKIAPNFTKQFAYLGLVNINGADHIGLFQANPLHLIIKLGFPIELNNLLGLLPEEAHGLLHSLEFMVLGMPQNTLQTHKLITLHTEGLQFLIVLGALLVGVLGLVGRLYVDSAVGLDF